MSHLEITKRRAVSDTSIFVLDLNGELTINTIAEFETVLKTYLQEKKLKVILNMNRVTYLSSTGIGALFSNVKEFQKMRGELKIAGLSQQNRELLDLLDLPELFHRYPDETEAVAAFRQNASTDP